MTDFQFADKNDRMRFSDQVAYESEEKLIIALNFGTAFSGISYSFANQRDTKIATIVDCEDKAPGKGCYRMSADLHHYHEKPAKNYGVRESSWSEASVVANTSRAVLKSSTRTSRFCSPTMLGRQS